MTYPSEIAELIRAPQLLAAERFPLAVLRPIALNALRTWNPPPTFKLGRHFEALVAQYIQQVLGADRFFQNVVLNRGAATLGELDVIFTTPDRPEITQHWELAAKFYLCQVPGGSTATADFVGPQGRDRLDLKIDKLAQQQLPLGQLPEAREWLHTHSLPERVISSLLVQGMLFYPIQSEWRVPLHPQEISQHHARGWWAESFPSELVAADSLWVTLPKLQWLSPIAPDAAIQPLTPLAARALCDAHFQAQSHALLFAQVTREHGVWQELCRGMIAQPTRALTSI